MPSPVENNSGAALDDLWRRVNDALDDPQISGPRSGPRLKPKRCERWVGREGPLRQLPADGRALTAQI